MELSGSNAKKFLIFFYISGSRNHKKILYISGNRNPEKLLIFQKIELLNPSLKKKNRPEKKLLYSRKWNFLALEKLNKTFFKVSGTK